MAELRRNAKVHLENPLHLIMGSIGSDVRYDLETRDLTTKGFFIESEQSGRFPFTNSSIVEVWIELEAGQIVFFNGKISRIILPQEAASLGEAPGIQFRIIQIDPEEEKKMTEYLNMKMNELEHSSDAETASNHRSVA